MESGDMGGCGVERKDDGVVFKAVLKGVMKEVLRTP